MSPRESALRRFTALWSLSVAWKIAALAVFLWIALRLLGGQGL